MLNIIKYSILIFSIFYTSCSNENEKKPEIEVKSEPKAIDFYHFKHFIPESEYAYDIEITSINLNSHKDAFNIAIEKYGKPEKVDGLTMTIEFNITNPYSRSMSVPFPEYFEISAKEFEGMNDFIYSKGCRCYITNATMIENSKGKPLSSFSKYTNDAISRQLLVDFEPKETKSIKINFTRAFPSYIKSVTFIGFNKHLKKQVEDYYKLTEQERKDYLADKSTEYGLVIDLKNKRIIGITEY